jgi:mRNA-degrading endonuclease toxin of MazEF toxin-antitoxin module
VPEESGSHRGVPRPGNPGVAIVMAANEALADPTFRDSVRKMHADGYPLVKMVEALGLEDDLTDHIREIIEHLDADVVAGIRAATLAMLDRADEQYLMPLDCTVTTQELAAGVPVEVEVLPEEKVQMIHVRPTPTSA